MLWHRWNLKTLCEVKEASLQEPYMIPFTRNMLHRQIYRDREWSGCLRLEETGRMGILARINEISLRCNGRDLNLWWGVHSSITILKVFELWTLNEWIKLYVNYISIKLVLILTSWQMLFSHSAMSDSATPWTIAHQAFLSFIISQGLLKFMSIESVMPSNHLILCHSLLLLPLIFPSVMANRWGKSENNDRFHFLEL